MGQGLDLLQFSDPHLFADRAGELRGLRTYHTLRATIAAARERFPHPDAILVTGDIAQDESRGAYERFVECFEGTDTPVFCVPGNHDNPTYLREAMQGEPFTYCGEVLSDAWIVVLLDSHDPGRAPGRLAASQLQRLAAQLAAHDDRHALIVLHHHPVASGSAWLDTVGLENADELFAIVDRHPRVRCLLWGHVHQASRARRGEVLLLSTPSTGSQFAPASETFALDDKPPGFRWLRLHADGTIATAIEWCESARG